MTIPVTVTVIVVIVDITVVVEIAVIVEIAVTQMSCAVSKSTKVSYEVPKDVFILTQSFNVPFNTGAPGTIPHNIIELISFGFPWIPWPDPGNM